MAGVGRRRWARAMTSVIGVERRSPALGSTVRPTRLYVAGKRAWRRDSDLSSLPAALQPEQEGPAARMWSPVTADLLAIGKFDVDDAVKLRSFYTGTGLTARLQVGRAGARHGVSRTLEAYRQASRYVPELMPRIDDHGHTRLVRGVYLVEELVSGDHLVTRKEVQELAEPLAAQLLRLYKGVGVTSCPLSAVVHQRTMERWHGFVQDFGVHTALDAEVRRIFARDALLEVSLGHGDLVGSNIMVSDGRIVLIDWEYAGESPIAFDLAKVQLFGQDTDATRASLERGLAHSVGHQSGHYSFAEQLALAHVQMLSWHQARNAKAVKAGREKVLAVHNRQRLRAIARLLDVDASAGGESHRLVEREVS